LIFIIIWCISWLLFIYILLVWFPWFLKLLFIHIAHFCLLIINIYIHSNMMNFINLLNLNYYHFNYCLKIKIRLFKILNYFNLFIIIIWIYILACIFLLLKDLSFLILNSTYICLTILYSFFIILLSSFQYSHNSLLLN